MLGQVHSIHTHLKALACHKTALKSKTNILEFINISDKCCQNTSWPALTKIMRKFEEKDSKFSPIFSK